MASRWGYSNVFRLSRPLCWLSHQAHQILNQLGMQCIDLYKQKKLYSVLGCHNYSCCTNSLVLCCLCILYVLPPCFVYTCIPSFAMCTHSNSPMLLLGNQYLWYNFVHIRYIFDSILKHLDKKQVAHNLILSSNLAIPMLFR